MEQQTATSEVLKVISGSPGELQTGFPCHAGKRGAICDAKFGLLFSVGGRRVPPCRHAQYTLLCEARLRDQ